jgi:hypothetical protein
MNLCSLVLTQLNLPSRNRCTYASSSCVQIRFRVSKRNAPASIAASLDTREHVRISRHRLRIARMCHQLAARRRVERPPEWADITPLEE